MNVAVWIYRRVLRLYPGPFRRAYGAEMVETFRTRATDARDERGVVGRVLFLGRELAGLLGGIAGQWVHVAARRRGVETNDRGRTTMTGWVREARHALRRLAKTPGFTVATVLTLALGIGATTAIFSVVDSVVLRPLPYPESDELVWLDHAAPGLNPDARLQMTTGLYLHYRERSKMLSDIAIWRDFEATLTGDGEPARVTVTSVTPSLGAVLKVQPLTGRWFTDDDGQGDGTGVAVLSHSLWMSRFGGDPEVVGRTILIDQSPLEVVGIMPASFTFPDEAMRALGRSTADTKLWIPEVVNPASEGFGGFTRLGVARLNPGVEAEEAQRELDGLLPRLVDRFPAQEARLRQELDDAKLTALVVPLKEHVVGGIRQTLWILLGAVGFVLLIACANVGNLFLVRAESREREVAVRTALGAERGDMIRFYLTESWLLVLGGAALGLALAQAGVRWLVGVGPDSLPRLGSVSIDGPVLAFTAVITVAASLVFGAIPLLRRSAGSVRALREGGRGSTTGRSRLHMRNVLVVSQMALALVLLVGSGLMLRSFRNFRSVDPGFTARDDVLTFQTGLPRSDYPTTADAAAFYQELLDRLGGLPGVETAGAVTCLPLAGWCAGDPLAVEGRPAQEGVLSTVVALRRATEGYLQAMGIPLLRGRFLERADHEQRTGAVVISQALAEGYFPGQNPLGRRVALRPDATNPVWYTIVGVVGNVPTRSVTEPDDPLIYFPMLSPRDEGITAYSMTVTIRASGPATALAPTVRRVVSSMDGTLALAGVRTMGDVLTEASARTAFTMVLLAIAALVALLLGAVGINGVVAYVVNQRKGEIGIRMALGARAADVHRMVLGQGAVLAGVGLALGLAGAFALSRVMGSLLYGVSSTDPATYAGVSLVLLAVAIFSALVPARRAARLHPGETLRAE